MNAIKTAAIALIIAGVLALVYGGFTYTKQTHEGWAACCCCLQAAKNNAGGF
jgi:hypothetical protein